MDTPSPTITNLLRDAAARLRGIDAGNPRLEAEYLLAAAFGCERIELFRRGAHEIVAASIAAEFERRLGRRLHREPLQYVLGTVPFCGLDLVIGPGALIPRSETEVLVEEVAKRILADPPSIPLAGDAPLLIDVGTGSGAILLALLDRLPAWRGIGIDRSTEALHWARVNRDRTAGHERAGLLRGDLLSSIAARRAWAIVSNPPYIRSDEVGGLAPEIREHEPHLALDGGEDGLDVVRQLIPEAARILHPGGWFALELAPDQPAVVAGLLGGSGLFEAVETFNDLAQRNRGVLARRR